MSIDVCISQNLLISIFVASCCCCFFRSLNIIWRCFDDFSKRRMILTSHAHIYTSSPIYRCQFNGAASDLLTRKDYRHEKFISIYINFKKMFSKSESPDSLRIITITTTSTVEEVVQLFIYKIWCDITALLKLWKTVQNAIFGLNSAKKMWNFDRILIFKLIITET